MGSQNVRMRFDGAASMLGDSRDILLKTDAAGYFDTTFVLKEPTYYTISRNTLYLTPGDDMTIKVTQTNTEAEFSGIGAEANNYMKFRLFPKGGSYLEAGGNLRGDFVSTKALVDSLAAIRMHTLDTLSNVSDAFKKLETARIKADIINSYICYASYSRMFAEVKNEEEMRAKWNEFNVSLTQDVTPLYKEIVNEDMLNVAVVRDVLSYQEDSTLASLWFKDISIPARTTELYACAKIVDNLRNEASEQTVNEAKAFLQTVKNADFATEIEGKIVQASKLLPGQPAIDFEMLDVEGNVKHLADFKGKVIYIDLWATWCGPCIQESPAFEALGKKYVGKDIVFLPVSTDTTTKPWLRYLDGHKKELTQYHSNDVALKESWAIMYIPRFILIDKHLTCIKKLIKSIAVTDGRFAYPTDSIQAGLYCFSLQNMERGEYLQQYANLFLEPKSMQLTLGKDKYDQLSLHATGSALQEQYEALQEAKYVAGNRMVLDSLDHMFYEAREKGDREEMERIREVSSPYYESASEQTRKLINGEIAKNKGSYFGLYLYYTYRFQNHTFNTVEEIDEARNFIGSFDEASRRSGIYVKMQEGLDKFARCATGSVAPAITGIDLKGNSVSLNDFKGKYVLVDFWFAGCSWCRKETPYLLKTYNAFKDKGFTIYGVSTDRREEDWKKAIEEDKSYWNQVLLQKDDVKDVLESYCIVGFPHIILVDPEGKIVAKELRGDDLYNTVEKFVNGAK